MIFDLNCGQEVSQQESIMFWVNCSCLEICLLDFGLLSVWEMGNRQIEPLTFTFLVKKKKVTISLIFMHKIYLFNAVLENLNCHLWLRLELVVVKHLNAWVTGIYPFGSAERNVEERALSLLKDLTPDFPSSRWKAFQTAKPLMRVVLWKDCRHKSEDSGSNLCALSEYPGDPGQALPWASDNSLSYLLNWNPFIIPQILVCVRY